MATVCFLFLMKSDLICPRSRSGLWRRVVIFIKVKQCSGTEIPKGKHSGLSSAVIRLYPYVFVPFLSFKQGSGNSHSAWVMNVNDLHIWQKKKKKKMGLLGFISCSAVIEKLLSLLLPNLFFKQLSHIPQSLYFHSGPVEN